MSPPPDSSSTSWEELLARAAMRNGAGGLTGPLADLFAPVLEGAANGSYVIAHLGQSLDGRIALPGGASSFITGPDDAVHNHRLRALCDAVIVGAQTVDYDDPQLTVRLVAGPHAVRVVIDPSRRLDPARGIFCDGVAPTLLVCGKAAAAGATGHGDADIVAVPAVADGTLSPQSIIDALAARGLTRLFIEGGGLTVSRFIEAGLVDRLHLTIAPILLGDGHPVLTLPAIDRIEAARRVSVRPVLLGDDLLYDGTFDDRG